MKKILLVCLALSCTGCALLKSERVEIPKPPPRLEYKDLEKIKQVAKVNQQIAQWIKENGIKAGDERSIILEDGSSVIVKYLGEPYEDVNANDLKRDVKIVNGGKNVAEDFAKDNAKYDDKMYDKRESLINQTNLKWDWKKILGGGVLTWLLVAVAVPVLCAFFPVIIPFVSIAWQVLKAGIGAVSVVAKFGISGMVEVVTAIEKFREAHAGTETGKALDLHLKAALPEKTQTTLDKFKNYFHI